MTAALSETRGLRVRAPALDGVGICSPTFPDSVIGPYLGGLGSQTVGHPVLDGDVERGLRATGSPVRQLDDEPFASGNAISSVGAQYGAPRPALDRAETLPFEVGVQFAHVR